jgi:hypothetical protein
MKVSDYALIDAARHGLLDEVKKLSKDCVGIGVGY